jgi:hypothetical protein
MKKLIVILGLASVTGLAQAKELTTSQVQQKATEITRAMAQDLKLNEHEYIKLKAMNIQKLVALNAILENHGNNSALANTMMQEIELAYHKQLAEVFSQKQMQHYLAWQQASKTDFTSFLEE